MSEAKGPHFDQYMLKNSYPSLNGQVEVCIDCGMYVCQYIDMNHTKRITANLPEELLEEASSLTKKGITETLIYGLQLIKRSKAFEHAQKLKGKLHLNVNLKESRERSSH